MFRTARCKVPKGLPEAGHDCGTGGKTLCAIRVKAAGGHGGIGVMSL